VEIVDRIRDLGWQGVFGNTDEMLFRPESLQEFASQSPPMQPLFAAIEEMAAATREALAEERLTWLRGLPPDSDSQSDSARSRQSPESLARTRFRKPAMPSWRRLPAARTADCDLWGISIARTFGASRE